MSSTASVLPPDIREKLNNGGGGIGVKARENSESARAREVAVNPNAVLDDSGDEESKDTPTEREEFKACPNHGCRSDLKDEWNYCAACGHDLLRGGPAKKIGIQFTEEDMHSYLFRGYVVCDLKILGKHKITVKSSQPKDLREIDDHIMNGDWAKNADGEERKISDFYLRQMNALCVTASAVIKVDGESIGDTLAKRLAWMDERGSAFVDLVSQRVSLFNQALTEFLKNEDAVLGS